MLWQPWWELLCELRSACARTRTFLWMAVCLAGMTTRQDLMGVTSLVRVLGPVPTSMRPTGPTSVRPQVPEIIAMGRMGPVGPVGNSPSRRVSCDPLWSSRGGTPPRH